jgi:hypothetical protein
MNNPFAPPGGEHPTSGRVAPVDADTWSRGWKAKLDWLLLAVLGLVVVPHVLLNAMLWFGHWQGIGLYDPEIGGDPAWRARSVVLPLLVAVAAAVRLFAAREWRPMGHRLKRGYAVVAVIALLTALVALIPEPSFWWR